MCLVVRPGTQTGASVGVDASEAGGRANTLLRRPPSVFRFGCSAL